MGDDLTPGTNRIPTKTLVELAAQGRPEAMETLCERLRPRLADWARGRLPDGARDLLDTDDLVQEAIVRSLRRLPVLDHQRDGSFLQYLKAAVLNGVRNEIRRVKRRGPQEGQGALNEIVDPAPTAIEEYLGKEATAQYVEALNMLSEEERDLVIARIELLMTPAEIARHTGKPTPDAARMAVRRAILKLATLMNASEKP